MSEHQYVRTQTSRPRVPAISILCAVALGALLLAACGEEPQAAVTDRANPAPTRRAPREGAGRTQDNGSVRSRDRGRRHGRDREARPKRTRVDRELRIGDRGRDVASLQRELEGLGYWMGQSDGTYGYLTEQAVFAFQGIEGLTRDGVAGPKTQAALKDATTPSPRNPRGDLIEIDERRQVLFIVRDGEVRWIFHASTGTDQPYRHPNGTTYSANTPDGRWEIFSQFPDGWKKSPLGRLWRPKYFHPDGIAIHGFPSVPPIPASHGCVRVSMEAMDYIWSHRLAPKKSPVWVYE
jgi:hypothetical protein